MIAQQWYVTRIPPAQTLVGTDSPATCLKEHNLECKIT